MRASGQGYLALPKRKQFGQGAPMIFIVQGPVWLGVYRILTVLLTRRGFGAV